MRCLVSSALIAFLLVTRSFALMSDRIACESEASDPILVNNLGEQKLLWIICAADSDAILYHYDEEQLFGQQRLESPGDTFFVCEEGRPEFPSTYEMPTWADWMFDSTRDKSLARYYLDQSFSQYWVTGGVIGQTDSTIFICDDTVRMIPNQCGSHTAGYSFQQNIMTKAEARVNFADYLNNPTDDTIYVIFNIYGHAEVGTWWNPDSNRYDPYYWMAGGGVSGGLEYDCETDTNSNGEFIHASGIVGWSTSEEFILEYADEMWGWNCNQADRLNLSIDQSFNAAMGIAAHEWGHYLGLSHTFSDSSNYGADDRPGMGSFDVMGYSDGFMNHDDPGGCPHRAAPGPYNPIYRMSILPWIDPVVVTSPIAEITLSDHLTTGDCLKIPAYIDPSTDPYGGEGQYFVVTAHKRRTVWDKDWPTDGVMIFHANHTGNQDSRGNKKYDFEISTGMTDWEGHTVNDKVSWEDTGVPNALSGLDSFDFVKFYGNGTPLRDSPWGYNVEGFVGNYFFEGDTFDFGSNPSSDAYNDPDFGDTLCLQNIPTMAFIAITDTNTSNLSPEVATLTAWSRHWSGVFEGDGVWHDSVVVDADLTFSSDATLTIFPGTKINVAPDAMIEFYGDVNLVGTASSPIIFDCIDTTATWAGLRVYSDDENNILDHVIVRRATYGVLTHEGYLEIDSSEFKYCNYGVVFTYSSGGVTNTISHYNSRFGVYLLDGDVNVVNNEITRNVQGGIRIVRGTHNLADNIIHSNGSQVIVYAPQGGIENLGAAITLRCNDVYENQGPGIFTFAGGFTSMARDKWNYVYDNMLGEEELEYDYGQLHMQGGHYGLGGGINSIYSGDDSGWLVRNSFADSVSFNMQGNYWGTTDTANIAGRLPQYTDFLPLYSSAQACWVGEDTSGNDIPTELFAEAWDDEQLGLYDDAIEGYDDLIKYGSSHPYRGVGLERMAQCQRADGWSWQDVRDFCLGITNTQTITFSEDIDDEVSNEAKGIAAWALANIGEFTEAYGEFEDLVDESTNEEDIIRNQLYAILVELKENGEMGLFQTPGRPDRPAGHADEDVAACADFASVAFTAAATQIDALIGGRKIKHSTDENSELPIEFSLSQNYPNPFNPSTEIVYSLATKAQTTLKIFEITGREVKTIVDEMQTAGDYKIHFDATTLPSGVYFYCLKAGEFSAAKKMVLIR